MVSDTRVHTTATVYAFQKKLLDNIKVTHPSLTKDTTIQMVVQGNIIILLTGVTIRDSGISLPHHMVKLHVMGLMEQQNGLPLMLVFSDPFQIKSLPLKICLHFAGTTYMVCIFTL